MGDQSLYIMGGFADDGHTPTVCSASEAGLYLRRIDSFSSLSLRLKDLLGPVTRVKQKKPQPYLPA
jgi:hypothetical protein